MSDKISRKQKKGKCAAALGLMLGLLMAVPGTVYADDEHSDYASSSEMANYTEVVKYGMTPIAGSLVKDGTWDIEVESSSKFFRVDSCQLIVEDGQMTARMTMETYSYPLLYLGTSEEAAAAPASDYIEYEDIDDWCVFTIPVRALNEGIDCAAFSKKKKKWYYRKILFDASTLDPEALDGLELPDYDLIEEAVSAYDAGDADASQEETGNTGTDSADTGNSDAGSTDTGSSADTEEIEALGGQMDVDNPEYAEAMDVDLEDGQYSIDVNMTGGSGRAGVSAPTLMIVKDGKAYAQLQWSSTYYDWMRVGGVVYKNETTNGGNSVFTIPISSMDGLIPVVADTTAMGDSVAIQYTLTFYRESIGDVGLIPQVAAKKVVIFAVILIVGGWFLNYFVKKRHKIKKKTK